VEADSSGVVPCYASVCWRRPLSPSSDRPTTEPFERLDPLPIPPSSTEGLRATAQAIRRRVLRHTIERNGGYLSQACSSAEILAALYLRILHIGPSEGPWIPLPFQGVPGPGNAAFTGAAYNGAHKPELDRFIFSPVHYALVLYATLIETGRLAPEALDRFDQDGFTLELIGAEHSPGHELTAGSLGQAYSQALGIALGRRRKGDSGRVWVFLSDGELQEGQTWETVQLAAWYALDNLGVVVDMNGQQCDGAMGSVMNVEPAAARFEAFGAAVAEVNGHDVDALCTAAEGLGKGRPLVILARTDACRGVEILRERSPKLHYVRFSSEGERERYRWWLDGMENRS
jgi:transketolase